MGEIDDLTREKLREWQMRRLEVKAQMQDQPERTLELSRVLDLMDEEHAAILAASTVFNAAEEAAQPVAVQDQPALAESVAGQYDLQLHASAQNPEHLRKLLEMALYEVQAQIEAGPLAAGADRRGMSGTLGGYSFELRISPEASREGNLPQSQEMHDENDQD
ncbi:hypothetical protein [Pseudomonas atacamensis]|uniref:hypothetical protein n=1 Tax=Pseudomonas atacamensis TaxID=2565368 RepID=UPI0019D0C13B|nr:hypothetical protein [Pseudomonas atacamensis]QSL86118.1 hypothetical protein JWU58_18320 [Pseudomonas atacamensis]